MKVRRPDGAVHISLLKKMALSPAHYKAAAEEIFEQTRPMRIGTIAHLCLFGEREDKPGVVVFDGDRRGTKWLDFKEENRHREIVTRTEWDEGEQIANAVRASEDGAAVLEGSRFEVPLKWKDGDIECATDGVDIISPAYGIVDLKSSQSSEPGKFMRTALNLYYPHQLAFYEGGAIANGIDTSKGLHILAVEATRPWPVTLFTLTPEMILHARKTVAKWMDRLRVSEENDFWPGYVQAPVPFDAPSWMNPVEDEEEAAE